MKPRHSIIAVLAVLALPGTVAAQDARPAAPPSDAPGPPLTLRQAIDEALAKHPDLAAIRTQFEADRLKAPAERSLMAPMVEMQAVEWPIDTLNPGNAKLMVMLGQAFPGRGKRDARAALAEREAETTGAELAVREQDLVLRVRRAYVDLQLARRTVGTYREQIALLRQIAEVAEAKYAAGRISQQDIVKAVLERSMLEEQVVMVEEQGRMAEAALNVLLDRPADATIGEVDLLADEVPVPGAEVVQRLALSTQPELAAVDADTARREAALAVMTSDRKVDYLVQGGFMVMPNETNAWTARFGFTWNSAPWARDRYDAQEQEAAAQIGASRARRKSVENALRLMVQEAWVRADAAVRRASLLRTSIVPQAQYAMDLARVEYQVDRASLLDVLDNERRLLDARLNLVRALAARDQALADLARAAGTNLDLLERPRTAASGHQPHPGRPALGAGPRMSWRLR